MFLLNKRYPKITLLILFIILTHIIFSRPSVATYFSHLGNYTYLSLFLIGFFFSFGFTTPFAIGAFIILRPENIFLASLIGGAGALLGDLVIFNIVKFSFADEFNQLKREKIFRIFDTAMKNNLGARIRIYFLYAFAGIIIASPLPDEVGVSMLAGLTHIKQKVLALFSFTLNTLGIFIIFILSR